MKKAPLYTLTLLMLFGLMLAQIVLPPRTVSDRENRTLTQFPETNAEALLSGEYDRKFEAFASDQAPFRDAFVSLHAIVETLEGKVLQNDVILGNENRLFDRSDGWSARNAALNANAFAELAAGSEIEAYLLLVPSSGFVYRELLPPCAPVTDEDALFDAAQAPGVTFLDIRDALREKREDAPLYFRTDHHWTLDGARIGYGALCEALSLTPLDMAADVTQEGFFGSFFARSPSPFIRGDVLAFPDPENVMLEIAGEQKPGLYDPEKLRSRDAYAALLYGNHGLLTLKNPDAPGGALFVLKDSYANLLLPTLARHYQNVIAVDARYFTGDIVRAVQESEAETLLCLFGINTFSQSRCVALLPGL